MSISPWNPDLPHNQLPPIPPAEWLETRPVLRACIGARAALASLNQAARLFPNPDILAGTLPVLEAQASVAIENIATTQEQLFGHLHAGAGATPATQEALRCHKALMDGARSLARRPLRTQTAVSACGVVKGGYAGVRTVTAVRLAEASTGRTIYTPPVGDEVIKDLLLDWERFLHQERELDPLVRLAAAHYQFLAIHPFAGGNGRTGRVLNSLFLVQEDLLAIPILCLSRYLIRHRDRYFDLLTGVTAHEAWEPWLLFMLEGVRESAQWTAGRVEGIRSLAEMTDLYVREHLPKVHSRGLVDAIFAHPYCRIENLVDGGVAQRQAASRYLKALAAVGVLEERKVGRDKLFVNLRLMELLASG